MRKIFLVALFSCLGALVTACGGGDPISGTTSAPTPTPTPTPSNSTFTIGGTVSGLNGSLNIKNNGTDQLAVNASGQFTFATPITQGGQYNVTIVSQPNTQTCTLTNYFGTNITANITTVAIDCVDNPPATTTLLISATSLALATSGNPRMLILTNTGTETASSINMTSTPALPTGTSRTTTCSASLAPGSSCNITITPGATPNSAAGSTSVASALDISGSNTNNVNADIYVLTYGNIYQSGYIFSIDDSASTFGSIGGKVLALADQPNTTWSNTDDNILGIYENSTNPCGGANDGTCNTRQIVAYYTALSRPFNNYAAGQCKSSTINGYGDWYLPSACELSTADASICPPAYQNIQTNLVSSNILALSNNYWSSTELSLNPSFYAYYANLNSSGGGGVYFGTKGNQLNVRCTRALTN